MREEQQKIVNQLECETEPSITIQVTEDICRLDYNLASGINCERLAKMSSNVIKITHDTLRFIREDAIRANVDQREFDARVKAYLEGTSDDTTEPTNNG